MTLMSGKWSLYAGLTWEDLTKVLLSVPLRTETEARKQLVVSKKYSGQRIGSI